MRRAVAVVGQAAREERALHAVVGLVHVDGVDVGGVVQLLHEGERDGGVDRAERRERAAVEVGIVADGVEEAAQDLRLPAAGGGHDDRCVLRLEAEDPHRRAVVGIAVVGR